MEDGIDDEACELVNGVELSIGEDDDNIRAYLFKAVKNNNGTGLLLLSDVFGFEDSFTRDFAYRVACNGYKYVPHLLPINIVLRFTRHIFCWLFSRYDSEFSSYKFAAF